MKRDCKQHKEWLRKNGTKGSKNINNKEQVNTAVDKDFAFITVDSPNNGSWIIDSGALCHIAAEKHFFSELNSTERGRVTVGNGMEVEAEGRGTCHIKFLNSVGKTLTATLSNVYYIPTMTANLLSANRLTANGFTLIFRKGRCDITRNGNVIAMVAIWFILFKFAKSSLHCCQKRKLYPQLASKVWTSGS